MDYSEFLIKEYDLWDLYLHTAQYPYIGRCYAWSKRESAKEVTDMDLSETSELFEIVIPEWNNAVKELFKHDRTNLACLCNDAKHLHWHLVPRYQKPREYGGITFEDPRPNHNYAPYPKKELDKKILLEIRDKIKGKIVE
ncbi:hypothetical protein HZA97_01440 [Candidatus Woesearchaeota archaeon]|nr:hypothetical protein [Candidatus Woesearchaeota archaeon]